MSCTLSTSMFQEGGALGAHRQGLGIVMRAPPVLVLRAFAGKDRCVYDRPSLPQLSVTTAVTVRPCVWSHRSTLLWKGGVFFSVRMVM